MTIQGRVHEGTVVLEDAHALPEGTRGTVSYFPIPKTEEGVEKKRLELPLVHSKRPGRVQLTSEQVADYLAEDDVSP